MAADVLPPWALMNSPLKGMNFAQADQAMPFTAEQAALLGIPPPPTPQQVPQNIPVPPAIDKMKQSVGSSEKVQTRYSGQDVLGGDAYKELIDRVNAREMNSLGQQQDQVKALQKQITGLQGKELPLNLQPLAALTDTWTGSHLAPYAAPQETAQTRREAIEKLQNQLRQTQQGLSQDEVNLLKSQLSNQYQMDALGYKQKQDTITNDLARQKLEIDRDKAGKEKPPHILPSTVVDKYTDAQGVVALASGLKAKIDANSPIMGPVQGGILGKNPYDKEHQILNADFAAVKQKIGKLMEGGVLRKEDEAKYDKIMPAATDLPETAYAKQKQLELMLTQDIARYMANYRKAGYDTTGFNTENQQYQEQAAKLSGQQQNAHDDTAAVNWAKSVTSKDSAETQAQAKEILRINGVK